MKLVPRPFSQSIIIEADLMCDVLRVRDKVHRVEMVITNEMMMECPVPPPTGINKKSLDWIRRNFLQLYKARVLK